MVPLPEFLSEFEKVIVGIFSVKKTQEVLDLDEGMPASQQPADSTKQSELVGSATIALKSGN